MLDLVAWWDWWDEHKMCRFFVWRILMMKICGGNSLPRGAIVEPYVLQWPQGPPCSAANFVPVHTVQKSNIDPFWFYMHAKAANSYMAND